MLQLQISVFPPRRSFSADFPPRRTKASIHEGLQGWFFLEASCKAALQAL
jgi:hypothetical protein